MEEVTDEPLYRDRVCGIDIGKAGLVATIRVPSDSDPARRMAETRSFGTTKREVLALADWLRCWQVPAVVMEATGDYWKGPFYRLEAEGFECVLADAKQVKNLPGRPKRDPADSRWLAACFERGAITSCFVATPGVPDHPAAHPVPAGPDRGAHPGEAAGGEAAGISGDQDLQRADRPARGDRPGHHGPPDRRGTQPQGAGPARPRRGPPQDPPARSCDRCALVMGRDDRIVPLAHGLSLSEHLPRPRLIVRDGEGHFGSWSISVRCSTLWQSRMRPRTVRRGRSSRRCTRPRLMVTG